MSCSKHRLGNSNPRLRAAASTRLILLSSVSAHSLADGLCAAKADFVSPGEEDLFAAFRPTLVPAFLESAAHFEQYSEPWEDVVACEEEARVAALLKDFVRQNEGVGLMG